MLVSNCKVYVTKEENGAISFIENGLVKRIIIAKGDLIPKQVFDLYYMELSSFKNRHYAIAKWIVKDIKRMGYDFKCMPLSSELFLPIKTNDSVQQDYPNNITREDKLRIFWREVDRLSKSIEGFMNQDFYR